MGMAGIALAVEPMIAEVIMRDTTGTNRGGVTQSRDRQAKKQLEVRVIVGTETYPQL